MNKRNVVRSVSGSPEFFDDVDRVAENKDMSVSRTLREAFYIAYGDGTTRDARQQNEDAAKA
jgi:hypothetical protein